MVLWQRNVKCTDQQGSPTGSLNKIVFDAIRQLMTEPEPAAKPPIGYATEQQQGKPRARLVPRAPAGRK